MSIKRAESNKGACFIGNSWRKMELKMPLPIMTWHEVGNKVFSNLES